MKDVADALNLGRWDAYYDIKDQIGAFQWSAILDHRTCPICLELDRKYFSPDDPLLDYIKPPIHGGCRCILVGVLKEELENYPVHITRISLADMRRWTVNKFWLRV